MKINRIDNKMEINKDADIIIISHDGEGYTIASDEDGIRVRKHHGSIVVMPFSVEEIVFR